MVGSQSVPKGWGGRAILAEGEKEIGALVDERVFVAYLESRNPPILHVGMVSVGEVNALPSAQAPLIAVVEVIEPVQIVKIPRGRGALTVDFHC